MSNWFQNLGYRLTQWNVILGLVLAVVGIVLNFIARPISMKFSQKDEEGKDIINGKLMLGLKLAGLALVSAGLIFTLID